MKPFLIDLHGVERLAQHKSMCGRIPFLSLAILLIGFQASGCARPQNKGPEGVQVYTREAVLPPEVLVPITSIVVMPSGPPSVLPQVEPAVEQAIFNLRRLYPRLKLVDRANLAKIENEQAFQNLGSVPSALAVKFGRMMGAQTVLAYQIQTTSDEEIEIIKKDGGVISTSVTVKLIGVETGETFFQTTTFDTRQIDPPQSHNKDQWPEIKLWRLNSVRGAGEQALGDLEVVLVWGSTGWHVTDMPPGRMGAWVRRVYQGGRAASAGIQPNDLILKVETPKLPPELRPPTGYWIISNKDALLEVISLPTNYYVLTVSRDGHSEDVKLWFDAQESLSRTCRTWRRNPQKGGTELRLVSVITCNLSNPLDKEQRETALQSLNFLLKRLNSSDLKPFREDFLLALEDLYFRDPKVLIGLDNDTQFNKILERMKALLSAQGREIVFPLR